MKYKLVVFILGMLTFWSCSDKRNEVRILTIGLNNDIHTEIQSLAKERSWLVETDSGRMVNADFIDSYSSVILPLSTLDNLYYRERNTIERYVEAGGGMVVLIDTVLNFPVWPITKRIQNGNYNVIAGSGEIQVIKKLQSIEWLTHLENSIGNNSTPDYSRVRTRKIPDEKRYTRQILVEGMDEPMQMQILPDGNVLIVERKGAVKLYDESDGDISVIARFNVFSGIEDGLLGVVLDPEYENNHWVYFYYAVGGDQSINRLSRMVFDDGVLYQDTEKVLLEIPTQRRYCCHSAGYLFFDSNGLLYLSVGDNTNAEEAEGYIPIDERPGRQLADDQATAANTNDLRGKILRIKPENDGSYSIPEGNLFPEGTPGTRPEIYIMGSRNPYRFSVDSKTGTVFWGDVGPDTKVEGEDGLMSYDEFNRADQPGFYGWPYFLGNNQAFPYYDFETKEEGPRFNPENPVNISPNNSGLKKLPRAQSAFIWYGRGVSGKFPLVGSGGASAMAGPVFHGEDFEGKPFRLPDYYEGKLLIYEWIRNWVMAVEFDENGEMVFMEPFLDQFSFSSPVDFTFGPDGALYVLEYGTNWFSKNNDAKLVRIEYVEGNRPPEVIIRTDKTVGAQPLEVAFDGSSTIDHDGDRSLNYTWKIEDNELEGEEVDYTFNNPGVYDVVLEVDDGNGGVGKSTMQVKVGNTPPAIRLEFEGNQSFYRGSKEIPYKIEINDAEDGKIPEDKIVTRFDFLENREDLALVLGNTESVGNSKYQLGKILMDESDCQSCHDIDEESVGPRYKAIAAKYAGREEAVTLLSQKIIEGGSGVWGSRSMTPHPDLGKSDAEEMVKYILSLDLDNIGIPANGNLMFNRHTLKNESGAYVLISEYTDKGGKGEVPPIRSIAQNVWISPKVEAEMFDEGNVGIATITTENLSYIRNIRSGTFVKFNTIDLSGISEIKYRVLGTGKGGTINLHLDSVDGPLVSSLDINGDSDKWEELVSAVEYVDGVHDLYFVFKNDEAGHQLLFNLDWVYFQ
ncbi:PQQ-dependent sugar dehydrogenase [Membranihabitans maritimus]|uniref:PQQ-dependent sugar dehydrogenase n=1 Tax=Membranihabitans maritimus TaxID=2904244 RepID=UPI001F1BBE2B|nr:PQQ-dependent sugar dehydrogenase [Membranihabitans maritimus]